MVEGVDERQGGGAVEGTAVIEGGGDADRGLVGIGDAEVDLAHVWTGLVIRLASKQRWVMACVCVCMCGEGEGECSASVACGERQAEVEKKFASSQAWVKCLAAEAGRRRKKRDGPVDESFLP